MWPSCCPKGRLCGRGNSSMTVSGNVGNDRGLSSDACIPDAEHKLTQPLQCVSVQQGNVHCEVICSALATTCCVHVPMLSSGSRLSAASLSIALAHQVVHSPQAICRIVAIASTTLGNVLNPH